MYQPVVARFMSRDPLALDGTALLHQMLDMTSLALKDAGQQPYSYVGNNPVNLVDPSGMKAIAHALIGLLQAAAIGKKSSVTLECPAYGCTGGPCTFVLSYEPKTKKNGAVAAGTKICLLQKPGEFETSPKGEPYLCQSEINRNLKKKDHITIRLTDETECKFTEDVFPPNESWPPIWTRLPPACKDVMTSEPVAVPRGASSQGGCFVTTKDVKAVALSFTMDISCFCETCRGFGENRDTIELHVNAK